MLKWTVQKIINQLIKSHQIPLKSSGISMEPIFHENDVLYFKKIAFKSIKVNDIVSIKKGKQLISHRVIYKTNKYLVTKGDNNPISDGKIFPKQIIGKVYQVKRKGQIFDPEQLYLLQSTLYFQEIVKIKTKLDKQGINYVFLKGLPLHLYFEKTHPRRIYLDCDVLVDKKDFFKAEKILIKNGYRRYNQSLSKIHTFLRKKQIELPFYKTINGFSVVFDVHLDIDWMSQQLGRLEEFYPQKFIDQLTVDFLRTKRKVKINNEFFFILDTKYLILYLALHIFHHNFRGAFRYEFLNKVIKYSAPHSTKIHPGSVIWADLTIRTNDFKLNNFIYPVFVLLKKYYQTPIPKSFFTTIQPFNNVAMKQWNNVNIFDDEPRVHAGITRFTNLFVLSPNPLWKRLLILLNLQVIYSVFWVVAKKIDQILSTSFTMKLKPRSNSL